MDARLSRAARIALDRVLDGLRFATVTGPFIWLPGTAVLMAFAGQYGWIAEETAGNVIWWAVCLCLILWLPASPLVRFLMVAAVEATADALRGVRWLIRRTRGRR